MEGDPPTKDNSPSYKQGLILYHSLILPLFDIIWGDKNNAQLMNDLQVQQNKAAKLILDKPKYSSASEALEELEWNHLDHRRHPHRCVFIFRCLHIIIDFNFNVKNKLDKAKTYIPSSSRF